MTKTLKNLAKTLVIGVMLSLAAYMLTAWFLVKTFEA